jgi:putative peptidoglycan lipid II flippase
MAIGAAIHAVRETMTGSWRGDGGGLLTAVLKLLSSNAVVTACNLLRDVSIAASLGATSVTDTFFLSISVPVFLVSVSTGSYRSVVLPLLIRVKASSSVAFEKIASRLTLVSLVGAVVVVTGVGTLLGGGYALSVGFEVEQSAKEVLGVMILVLPMYGLSAIVEMSQAPLQAAGALFFPNLSRAVLPLGVVCGALVAWSGGGLASLIVGGTIGALIGAAIVVVQLRRHAAWPNDIGARLPPAIRRQTLSNYRALTLATSINFLSPLVGQWLAGLLGDGAVSTLGYANRLTVGVVAIVTGSIAPVLLGVFARNIQLETPGKLSADFVSLTAVLAWAGCTMTFGFWISSDILISLLFQRGAFGASEVSNVRLLADCYAVQFPLLMAATTATSLISASSLNRIFVRIGVLLFVVNVALSIALMSFFQVAGIAVASSLTYALSLLLLMTFLVRNSVIEIRRSALVNILSAFVALGLAGGVVHWVPVRMVVGATFGQVLGGVAMMIGFAGIAVLANVDGLRRFRVLGRTD